jgi:hypothetical protein
MVLNEKPRDSIKRIDDRLATLGKITHLQALLIFRSIDVRIAPALGGSFGDSQANLLSGKGMQSRGNFSAAAAA